MTTYIFDFSIYLHVYHIQLRIYICKYRHIEFPQNCQMVITIPVLPGVSRFGSTTFGFRSRQSRLVVLFSSEKNFASRNWLKNKLCMDADDVNVDAFCVSLDTE